jgi:predicted ATPase
MNMTAAGVPPAAGEDGVSRVRRFILTGAPGAGKTAIADELARRGYTVIAEAATDVIADRQAHGQEEPWEDPAFLDLIVTMQRHRQHAAAPGVVQVYDRSPLCTVALARFLNRPITVLLAAEVERVQRKSVYERGVFLVQPIGFVTATPARRITYQESLAFARIHEQVYLEHGYELIDVPPADATTRTTVIDNHIRLMIESAPRR